MGRFGDLAYKSPNLVPFIVKVPVYDFDVVALTRRIEYLVIVYQHQADIELRSLLIKMAVQNYLYTKYTYY